MKKSSNLKSFIIIMIILFIPVACIARGIGFIVSEVNAINVLSSYENQEFESTIREYAKKENIKVNFTYMGDLAIVEELNKDSSNYDAVWISNSIWLYMLDNSYLTSNSKSISISPVVMGIKKSKANELGLVNKTVTNQDILNLIKNKQIKYVMSSVTQTNTGATAYLGFLNGLANSPEVLTSEMLDNDALIQDMINLFSGVERVSGDEKYLEDMFIKGTDYEAIITSESSIISINSKLKEEDKLYMLYPVDGVPINDSTFAFIDNKMGKKDNFLKLQSYLLSSDGQKELAKIGKRTWYGGVSKNVDKNVFNPSYGIDTNKYLITSKYPSKAVMTKALNLYVTELRKPTHVVFCLDYSGSMNGSGVDDLRNAMNYILNPDEASKDLLQFSKRDKISVVTFNTRVDDVWHASGLDTLELRNRIAWKSPAGSTAMYAAIEEGINILNSTSDEYTKTIIAMTDGEINVGSLNNIRKYYTGTNKVNIPVYSIMFGDSSEYQLNDIAELTNAKVFDGKTDLLRAFKEVRGYN